MSGQADQAPKKPLLPPSRIAVIVFAIVAAIIVVFELRARSQWDGTYQALSKQLEDHPDGFPKSVVEEHLKGNPTREVTKDSELFTWSGVLQKYYMRLGYSADTVLSIAPTKD